MRALPVVELATVIESVVATVLVVKKRGLNQVVTAVSSFNIHVSRSGDTGRTG